MIERKVVVRWHDGYIEEFNTNRVRFGNNLLWLQTTNGLNRHIPLSSVRWFSLSIGSFEFTP